jgi:hypothetical protein
VFSVSYLRKSVFIGGWGVFFAFFAIFRLRQAYGATGFCGYSIHPMFNSAFDRSHMGLWSR